MPNKSSNSTPTDKRLAAADNARVVGERGTLLEKGAKQTTQSGGARNINSDASIVATEGSVIGGNRIQTGSGNVTISDAGSADLARDLTAHFTQTISDVGNAAGHALDKALTAKSQLTDQTAGSATESDFQDQHPTLAAVQNWLKENKEIVGIVTALAVAAFSWWLLRRKKS